MLRKNSGIVLVEVGVGNVGAESSLRTSAGGGSRAEVADSREVWGLRSWRKSVGIYPKGAAGILL